MNTPIQRMSTGRRISLALVMAASGWIMTGCGFDGGPLISNDSDHRVILGGDAEDSKLLSTQVRQALRNNAQTSLSLIQVSQPSDDTVRLIGSVDNDAIYHEAERVAYQISGVRYVVNTLNVKR